MWTVKQNVGRLDRVARAVIGLGLVIAGVLVPMPLVVRVVAFGAMGTYLLLASVFGRCVGYHLLGKSTCSLADQP